MKKNVKKQLFLVVLGLAMIASACNKTQITANRFIDAGDWTVTQLTVDGTAEAELPSLEIGACEIYDEVCSGEWKNDEGGHAEFAWQFREKGKTFEISRQEGEHSHSHDHASEEAVEQCIAFSGVYEVTESSKDAMQFQSTATLGHAGKTVVMRIEKK